MKLELLVPDSMVGSVRADGTASLDGGLWLHDVCDAFADAVASRSCSSEPVETPTEGVVEAHE